MYRKPDEVGGFNLYYGRYASWVVHNMWGRNILADDVSPEFLQNPENMPQDGRKTVKAVLGEFLKDELPKLPDSYRPRDLIYYGTPYTHEFTEGPNKGKSVEGVLGLLFAADAPTDERRSIMVLAVQLPLSSETAVPGHAANCHLTTEIYPADGHSLIPVSYEFARGTIPSKRLNYIVNRTGEFQELPQKPGVKTGFKHFVSASYSKAGIFQLDFQLDVRHRPPDRDEQVHRADQFYATRDEFDFRLRQAVLGPLERIQQQIDADKGTFAPRNVNAASFLANVPGWMADAAYTNMAIFRQEYDSNINPLLHRERFGKDVQVPVERKPEQIDYAGIAGVFVRYPGALRLALLLADKGEISSEDARQQGIIPEEQFLDTLMEMSQARIINSRNNILRLTDTGKDVIERLRNAYKGEAVNVGSERG